VLAGNVESLGFIHTFSTFIKAYKLRFVKKILFALSGALSNIFPSPQLILAYVLSFERQYLLRYFRLVSRVLKIYQGSLPFRQKNTIFEY
jgi:hypothetical protein